MKPRPKRPKRDGALQVPRVECFGFVSCVQDYCTFPPCITPRFRAQDGRDIPSQHRASGSRETLAVAIVDWGLGQGRGRGIRGGERGCEGLFRVSEGPWTTARDLVLALRKSTTTGSTVQYCPDKFAAEPWW
jgi:hypothetical protein